MVVGYHTCSETSKPGPQCLTSHTQSHHFHPNRLHREAKTSSSAPSSLASPNQSWAPCCLPQILSVLPLTFPLHNFPPDWSFTFVISQPRLQAVTSGAP